MNKYFFVIILCLILSGINAVTLEKIYHGDFGEVNRTVLVFDSKPNYKTIQQSENKKIIVRIKDCKRGNSVQQNTSFPGKVLKSLSLQKVAEDLSVHINTEKKYYLKTSYLTGKKYKLVLDIFNNKNPETLNEHLSYAKFYYTVGFLNKALKEYRKIEKIAPQNTGIYYWWGMVLAKRGRYAEASDKFEKVSPQDEEYADAQKMLKKYGGGKKSPAKKPVKKVEKPRKKEVSPVSKQNYDDSDDTAQASDLYKKYKEYFKMVDSEDYRLFLVGSVASKFGDWDYAIKKFNEIDENSPLTLNVNKELLEIYEAMGDEKNAKLYKSLVEPEKEEKTEKKGFMMIEMKLWVALVMALFSATVGVILTFIFKKGKSEDKFSVDDIEFREDALKRAYANKREEKEEKNESDSEKNDDAFINSKAENDLDLQFGENADAEKEITTEDPFAFGSDFDEDNPPVLSEEITEDEIAELMEQEKNILSGIEEEPEQEGDDSKSYDLSGFGNEEYKKKMIMKFYAEGWDTESIAKELQISQREVEFIIKMYD
ncbi:MAG: hypothetical protein CSB55_03175 [Candidatus Cloacimonadota bacterium]|nr:MAG: hypothetical protein CSB55_03175 [Candidatus Cloacimonadota bacterium]